MQEPQRDVSNSRWHANCVVARIMTRRAWNEIGHLRVALPANSLLFLALILAGCGTTNASNPSGTDASSSGAGGSSGTGGSGGSPGAGESGNGGAATFDCTSSADPGDLVPVLAGQFLMGCNEAVDSACLDDEKPMHMVSLSAFEIDRTEVSQDQYSACVVAGACDVPSCAWDCDRTDYPATCVSWAQADAYCSWAGKRLPTESEWEKAARGSSGNKYPWGDSEPDCTLTNQAGCGEEALPVGSQVAGASPYGALDMAGNVVEIVADWYDASYYSGSPNTDPKGPASGTRYGGRGGGFRSDATWQRASKRDWYDLSDSAASLGFRCAR
jgi:formylglycine-generating enzyme required for sulfatase activity